MKIEEITVDGIMAECGEPAELREAAGRVADLRKTFEAAVDAHTKTLHLLQQREDRLRRLHPQLHGSEYDELRSECVELKRKVKDLYRQKCSAEYALAVAERDEAELRNPHRDSINKTADEAVRHLMSVIQGLRQRKEKRGNLWTLNKRIVSLAEFSTE